jgi:hypothetical protein
MRKLAGLQFKFVYKKGVENVVADAPSRVGVHYHLDAISTTIPFWIQEVLNSYENDPEASALLQELVISSPNDRGYSFTDGIIRHKNRIWIGQNSPLQTKLISTFHTSALGGTLAFRLHIKDRRRCFIGWVLNRMLAPLSSNAVCVKKPNMSSRSIQGCYNHYLCPNSHGMTYP